MTPPITGWWLCLHLARAGTTIIMLIYRCPAWPAVVRDRHELVWDLDAEDARLRQADQIGTMTLSRLLGSVVEAPILSTYTRRPSAHCQYCCESPPSECCSLMC